MVDRVDAKTKEQIEADMAEIDNRKAAPVKPVPKLATEDGPVCHSCTFGGKGKPGTGLIDQNTICPYCNGTGHLA